MNTKVTKNSAGDWKVTCTCENATVVANVFRLESGGWRWAVETVNGSDAGCFGLEDWTKTRREGIEGTKAFAEECKKTDGLGWCC